MKKLQGMMGFMLGFLGAVHVAASAPTPFVNLVGDQIAESVANVEDYTKILYPTSMQLYLALTAQDESLAQDTFTTAFNAVATNTGSLGVKSCFDSNGNPITTTNTGATLSYNPHLTLPLLVASIDWSHVTGFTSDLLGQFLTDYSAQIQAGMQSSIPTDSAGRNLLMLLSANAISANIAGLDGDSSKYSAGFEEIITLFNGHVNDTNATDSNHTAMDYAIAAGNHTAIEELLNAGATKAASTTSFTAGSASTNALMTAINQVNNGNVVTQLANPQNADLTTRYPQVVYDGRVYYNITPLMYAVIVDGVLQTSDTSTVLNTILNTANVNNNFVAALLLKDDATAAGTAHDGMTALMYAIRFQRVSAVTAILAKDIGGSPSKTAATNNPRAATYNGLVTNFGHLTGVTPLIYAILMDSIQASANIDTNGIISLITAASPSATILRQADTTSTVGFSPLMWAIKFSNLNAVNSILAKNLALNTTSDSGQIGGGIFEDTFTVSLINGVSYTASGTGANSNYSKIQPLMYAVEVAGATGTGNAISIINAISANANFWVMETSYVGETNWTALYRAIQLGNGNAVYKLVFNGASLAASFTGGPYSAITPVMYALISDQAQQNTAAYSTFTTETKTPRATTNVVGNIIAALTDEDFDSSYLTAFKTHAVDAQDANGMTALHYAIQVQNGPAVYAFASHAGSSAWAIDYTKKATVSISSGTYKGTYTNVTPIMYAILMDTVASTANTDMYEIIYALSVGFSNTASNNTTMLDAETTLSGSNPVVAYTPLILAAKVANESSNTDVIALLITNGATKSFAGSDPEFASDYTALFAAVQSQNADSVRELMQDSSVANVTADVTVPAYKTTINGQSISIPTTTYYDITPLMYAIIMDSTLTTNPNQDSNGIIAAIGIADLASAGHQEFVAAAGDAVSRKANTGRDALALAIRFNNWSAYQTLKYVTLSPVEGGGLGSLYSVYLHAVSLDGNTGKPVRKSVLVTDVTALNYAVYTSEVYNIRDAGTQEHATSNHTPYTALENITDAGPSAIVYDLAADVPNINTEDSFGYTAYLRALAGQQLNDSTGNERVLLGVEGVNTTASSSFNRTSLMVASAAWPSLSDQYSSPYNAYGDAITSNSVNQATHTAISTKDSAGNAYNLPSGTTALMLASQLNHPLKVTYLIQGGANPALQDSSDKTAWDYATSHTIASVGKTMQQEILQAADSTTGMTVLHYAVQAQNSALVSSLLSASASQTATATVVVGETTYTGVTPMLYAMLLAGDATSGTAYTIAIALITASGAPVNTADSTDSLSPLHWAIKNQNLSLANALLNVSASQTATATVVVGGTTYTGVTPMLYAMLLAGDATSGTAYTIATALITASGAPVNTADSTDSLSPLHWAIKNQNLSLANAIIEADANLTPTASVTVNSVAYTGITPLIYAILLNGTNTTTTEISYELVTSIASHPGDNGANNALNVADTTTDYGYTPFEWALRFNNLVVGNNLLSQGATTAVSLPANSANFTPLHWAVLLGESSLVNALLNASASQTATATVVVGGTTYTGVTPMLYAMLLAGDATSGTAYTIATALIIASGAPVNTADSTDSLSPLHWAIKNQNLSLANAIIEADANLTPTASVTVNSVAYTGITPLIYAILLNGTNTTTTEISYELVTSIASHPGDNGANNALNVADTTIDYGYTPFEWALRFNNLVVGNNLLSQGATTAVSLPANSANFTPLHWAVLLGESSLVNALLSAGASQTATATVVVGETTYTGVTPMLYAMLLAGDATSGTAYTIATALITASGAPVNTADSTDSLSPLHWAIKNQNSAIAQALLQGQSSGTLYTMNAATATVTVGNVNGFTSISGVTPIIYAILLNGSNTTTTEASYEIIALILDNSFNTQAGNAADSTVGLTPLMWAIYFNNIAVVNSLISSTCVTTGGSGSATAFAVPYSALFPSTAGYELSGFSVNGTELYAGFSNGTANGITPTVFVGMCSNDAVDGDEHSIAGQIIAALYAAQPSGANIFSEDADNGVTGLMLMAANGMQNTLSYIQAGNGISQSNVQASGAIASAYNIANIIANNYTNSAFAGKSLADQSAYESCANSLNLLNN